MSDDEVSAILDKLASRIIIRRVKAGRCCREISHGVIELDGLDSLMNAIKTCRVVLVNIYSTYCPYCRTFHIVYEDTASKYSGRVGFYRINIDHHPEVAYRLNILGTPTTLVFVRSRLVNVIPGLVFHDVLEGMINKALRDAGCIDSGDVDRGVYM